MSFMRRLRKQMATTFKCIVLYDKYDIHIDKQKSTMSKINTRSRNPIKSIDNSLSLNPDNITFSFDDSYYETKTSLKQKKSKSIKKTDISIATLNDFNLDDSRCTEQEENQETGRQKAASFEDSIHDGLVKQEQQEDLQGSVKIQEQQAKLEELQAPSHSQEQQQSTDTAHQRNEQNAALHDKPHDNTQPQLQMHSQQDLRRKMRKIDNQIRSLCAQKNRYKYMLKKQEGSFVEGQDKQIETKFCKCCGKEISKLCFRCDHVYCKVQNCPRKKKQILNARMLEKMREKKGNVQYRKLSKKMKLKQKRSSKLEEDVEQSQDCEEEDQIEQEDSYLEDDPTEDSTQVSSNTRHQSTHKQPPLRYVPMPEVSLSGLSELTFKDIYDSSSE